MYQNLILKIRPNEIYHLAAQSYVDYFKKVITPTSHEMENHKNFLKKELKKNFY